MQTLYGKEYLSKAPRQFSTKARNAQGAHEAIRPSGESFRTPGETGLDGRDLALYELIWKRTVASQMAEARLTMLAVDLSSGDASFRASGKRIDFPGFFRAYVEGSDDPDAALEGQEVLLPALAVGDTAVIEHLEQDVEDLWIGLVHLQESTRAAVCVREMANCSARSLGVVCVSGPPHRREQQSTDAV